MYVLYPNMSVLQKHYSSSILDNGQLRRFGLKDGPSKVLSPTKIAPSSPYKTPPPLLLRARVCCPPP